MSAEASTKIYFVTNSISTMMAVTSDKIALAQLLDDVSHIPDTKVFEWDLAAGSRLVINLDANDEYTFD